jgi:beta-phosphoglucomutase-like phosphatase (HAD superfamily)
MPTTRDGAPRDTLLFDLDGTLTDADTLHFEAFRKLLARFGRPITFADHKTRIMGWLFPDRDRAEHQALA